MLAKHNVLASYFIIKAIISARCFVAFNSSSAALLDDFALWSCLCKSAISACKTSIRFRVPSFILSLLLAMRFLRILFSSSRVSDLLFKTSKCDINWMFKSHSLEATFNTSVEYSSLTQCDTQVVPVDAFRTPSTDFASSDLEDNFTARSFAGTGVLGKLF